MIEVLIVVGYAVAGVLLSRPIYGHLRARSIDRNVREYPGLYEPNLIERWKRYDAPEVNFFTFVLSALWPGALLYSLGRPLARAVGRYAEGSPVRSRTEVERESAQQARRIAELEKELRL